MKIKNIFAIKSLVINGFIVFVSCFLCFSYQFINFLSEPEAVDSDIQRKLRTTTEIGQSGAPAVAAGWMAGFGFSKATRSKFPKYVLQTIKLIIRTKSLLKEHIQQPASQPAREEEKLLNIFIYNSLVIRNAEHLAGMLL